MMKKKDIVLENSDLNEDINQNEVSFEDLYQTGDFVIVTYV